MAQWIITGTTTSPTYWKVRAVVTEQSQDIANNTTSLKVSLQLGRDVVSSYIYAYFTKYYINIGSNQSGNQDLNQFIWDPAPAGGWKEIASRTVTVTHDADGTKKNLAIAAKWFQTGVTPTEASVSGTVTLTTIPRATTPTTPISGAMGSTITITLPRASNTFVHYLSYTFGGAGGVINAGTAGASCTWQIPKSLANQVPNGTSGTGTITCHTYAGSYDPLDPQKNYIGTKTVSFTATVPNTAEFEPSCSFTITEAVNGLNTQFGTFVQNKSKLRIQTTAAGAYSSTIQRIDIFADSKQYSGNDTTTDVITSTGTLTIVVSVTDSRNRHKAVSQQITVAAYSAPTGSLSGVRALQDGTADQNGEYLRYNVKWNIASVNSHNTKSVKLQYKEATVNTWTSLITWTSDYSKTITGGVSGTAILDANKTYNIRLEITDYFGTLYVNHGNIPTAFVLWDNYGVDGTGLAFGKVAETSNLMDVALPAKFRSTLVNNDGDAIDSIRNAVEVPNGSDLNSYNKSGFYFQQTSANTSNMQHIPENRGFWMVCNFNSAGTYGNQIICFYATHRLYQRSCVGGSFSDWTQLNGDVIVDQGVSGDWHYRKWSSGYAEADGVCSFTPTWSTSGSMRYVYRTENLPFTFVKCYSCDCSVQRGSYISFASSNSNVSPASPGSNQTTVQALVMQWNNGTASDIKVLYKVTGTWK